MKQTMIKNFSIMLGLTAMLGFSSCLKDSNYVDFAAVGTTIEIPLSGKGGITSLAGGSDTVVKQFAVNIASPKPLSSDLTVTLAVDPAALTAYNTANTAVVFEPFPTGSYTIDKLSAVIPAGTRTQLISITFDKTKLDPSKSYMLPISITDAQGQTINGNYHTKYYSIIGNDFAGAYTWDYIRYNANTPLPTPSGGTALGQAGFINPVTPTEFTMITGYNGHGVRYDVTFTKTGPGAYSNFKVKFVPSDVTDLWGPSTITVTQDPVFEMLDPATKHFRLQYIAYNGSANRYIIDDYHK